mgnify:FL=1
MSIHCDDIDALNLSESELKTLIRRYTLQPQKLSLHGSSIPTVPPRLRMIGDLKRLTGHTISATDAEAFQEASDKLGNEEIEMNLLVDEEASFTIGSTLEAKAPYTEFPKNWKLWETKWGHKELAKVVTMIWGRDGLNTHVTIGDELQSYDLQMDTPKMALHNIRGEQEVVGGIMTIFARRPISDYNSADKQLRYVKILHLKLHKDNIYRQDMEALPKADTVKQWIRDFKQVREKGRQRVHSAIRYGAVLQPVERSYKDQSKRHPEGDSYRADTSRQESKRQKHRA